jgi:acyl-CoA thioester hydrolase
MLEGFRFIHRRRVELCDTDMVGHVNNVAYLRWCETARCEYFADVIGGSLDSHQGLIIARMVFDYDRQVEYRDYVSIGGRIGRIGTKSFDFEYLLWNETKSEICARGTAVLVAYDYDTQATIVVPEAWRRAVAAFETESTPAP